MHDKHTKYQYNPLFVASSTFNRLTPFLADSRNIAPLDIHSLIRSSLNLLLLHCFRRITPQAAAPATLDIHYSDISIYHWNLLLSHRWAGEEQFDLQLSRLNSHGRLRRLRRREVEGALTFDRDDNDSN